MGSAVCNICMNALTLKVGIYKNLVSEFVNFLTEELCEHYNSFLISSARLPDHCTILSALTTLFQHTCTQGHHKFGRLCLVTI